MAPVASAPVHAVQDLNVPSCLISCAATGAAKAAHTAAATSPAIAKRGDVIARTSLSEKSRNQHSGILPRYGYQGLKPVAHIELSGDHSGNLVGNLTRKSAGFPVWARMVKEGLTSPT